MLDAASQRIPVRQAGIGRARDQQPAERRNRIQILLGEQIGGVVGDVIVGKATATLVRPREHRGSEIVLRLHIEQGTEVEHVEKVPNDVVWAVRLGLEFVVEGEVEFFF